MKVKLWCCTHDLQSKEEEIVDLEEYGFTKNEITKIANGGKVKDLNEIAKDFFFESKQPEWGYEIITS